MVISSKRKTYPGYGMASMSGKRSMNTTPMVSLEWDRQRTRHLRGRPRRVMRKINSSGTAVGFTPVTFARILEQSPIMQGRGELPSIPQIVADEFHSTRRYYHRTRLIGWAPPGLPSQRPD